MEKGKEIKVGSTVTTKNQTIGKLTVAYMSDCDSLCTCDYYSGGKKIREAFSKDNLLLFP